MKMYYYLFYKLYKFWETAPARFWSDFKSGISIIALEVWLLFSLFNYYSLIRNEKLDISFTSPVIIFPLVLIFIVNYWFFVHNNKWKYYVVEFDKIPRNRNLIGGIIVWLVIVIIIVNFFVSGYLVQKNVLQLY